MKKWDTLAPLYRGDEPSEIAITLMVETMKTDPAWDHIDTATQRRAVAKSVLHTIRLVRRDDEGQP